MTPISIAVDTGFPWDAVATAASGVVAVVAAVVVGWRQVDISRRQAAIQETLAGIEQNKLKAELLDRRMEIHDAIWGVALWPRTEEEDTRRRARLSRACDSASFLFSADVTFELERLRVLVDQRYRPTAETPPAGDLAVKILERVEAVLPLLLKESGVRSQPLK